MNSNEINKLASIIGDEDKVLELCSVLANKRLPGKKFCYRILKKRFREEFQGQDVAGFAKKYEVSISSLYNWLNE